MPAQVPPPGGGERVRILSIGCCDAGIEFWLQEQEQLGDIHVDGVDLDINMVAAAQQRAKDRGLTWTFTVSAGEQVADHYPAGSYDAVVAYEVIEHVIDPDAFLQVCSSMCTPTGRVYISTPDGTFGTGGNPHHLRVYRTSDLADLLRKHGHLQDMLPGPDGVAVGCYTPTERKRTVAIYTGPGWQTWSPMDVIRKGLGGSETAAVRLAEQLDRRGYLVTVYGQVEETCYRSVMYRHHDRFDPLDDWHTIISSRIPHLFDRPTRARRRLLWVHDVDCGPELTAARAQAIDAFITLSAWHTRHFTGRYPFTHGRVVQLRNGITPSLFQPQPWQERAPRALYTSSPDRGLEQLLTLWPQVREQVPEAVLAFCYADVYNAVADQQPEIAAHRTRLKQLIDQTPGATPLGSLPQPKLAELMCSSRVWAHPSWAANGEPFHETSCIGAMEAQAAGCHVVASCWGALPETVRYGQLLGGRGPGDPVWEQGMVNAIVAGLQDANVGQAAVELAPKAVQELSWAGVAQDFIGLIEQ